jgi:hypothetical protein
VVTFKLLAIHGFRLKKLAAVTLGIGGKERQALNADYRMRVFHKAAPRRGIVDKSNLLKPRDGDHSRTIFLGYLSQTLLDNSESTLATR